MVSGERQKQSYPGPSSHTKNPSPRRISVCHMINDLCLSHDQWQITEWGNKEFCYTSCYALFTVSQNTTMYHILLRLFRNKEEKDTGAGTSHFSSYTTQLRGAMLDPISLLTRSVLKIPDELSERSEPRSAHCFHGKKCLARIVMCLHVSALRFTMKKRLCQPLPQRAKN